ncbi:TfoX/Sxy family protein [Candidatus Hydrogenedentota bacterium]
MSVSDEYLLFIEDQLEGMGNFRMQRAFGQVLVSCDEVVFAFIIDDVLYFKVDETNKPDYEKAGITRWAAADKNRMRCSYEVPTDVLEDREELALWVKKAIAAAKRRPGSNSNEVRRQK